MVCMHVSYMHTCMGMLENYIFNSIAYVGCTTEDKEFTTKGKC